MTTGPTGGEPQEVFISSKSWSAISPGLFNSIRDELLEEWAREIGVDVSDLPFGKTEMGRILTEFGDAFQATEGAFPISFPEVADHPEIWTRISRHVTGADLLPPIYAIGDTIYENFPDMPGPVVSQNPLRSIARSITPNLMQRTGVSQSAVNAFFDDIDIDNLAADLTQASGEEELFQSGASRGTIVGADPSTASSTGGERTRDTLVDAFAGGAGDIDERFKALVGRGLLNMAQNRVPQINPQDHARFTEATAEEPTGGGRGTLSFDTAALNDAANGLWGQILWETPPSGLVGEYVDSANRLFKQSGVQQSFEAFAMTRMRETAKYGVMYGRMEPGFTEMQWQNRFNTSQFGLRLEDERAQSIRGMSSAAAPASFQQSVEQSRDVQSVGQGRFSQRFANHINQLGRLQNR